MNSYTTVSGDQWDYIAYRVYGNERAMGKLLSANPQYSNYNRLPAGLTLVIPPHSDVTIAPRPPWRR